MAEHAALPHIATPVAPVSGEGDRLRRYAGGLLLALCFALFGWQAWRGREPAPVTPDATAPLGAPELRVQVSGAVANPGVYRLAPGERVEDAVRAAGGFTPEADLERVNLAQRVRDEQRLEIPVAAARAPDGAAARAPDGAPPDPPTGADRFPSAMQGNVTPAAVPPPASAPGRPWRVNVNQATAVELEALPGIGPVSASPPNVSLEEGPLADVLAVLAPAGAAA